MAKTSMFLIKQFQFALCLSRCPDGLLLAPAFASAMIPLSQRHVTTDEPGGLPEGATRGRLIEGTRSMLSRDEVSAGFGRDVPSSTDWCSPCIKGERR